jgi:hypothetical protein
MRQGGIGEARSGGLQGLRNANRLAGPCTGCAARGEGHDADAIRADLASLNIKGVILSRPIVLGRALHGEHTPAQNCVPRRFCGMTKLSLYSEQLGIARLKLRRGQAEGAGHTTKGHGLRSTSLREGST